MSHIFISYSHKDKDYIHKLQEALQNEGFEVWIDDRIDYGTVWPKVIQDQLDSSDALILVMTPRSYDSNWVQNELDRARENGIQIFPLLLEGRQWLSVQTLQYVDVRDKSLPPEKFYKRLANVTPRNKPVHPPVKQEEKTVEQPKPEVTKPVETKKLKPVFTKNIYIWIMAFGVIVVSIILALALQKAINSNPQIFGSASASTNTPLPTSIQTSIPSTPILTETPISIVTLQPTQTSIPLIPTSSLGIGSTMISPKDGMTLMYVPAGNFTMGAKAEDTFAACQKLSQYCDLNWFASDQPPHQVYLNAFWIDKTDVTNAMYARCVSADACQQSSDTNSNTRKNYYGNPQFDDYPVVYVNWYMATAYCKWTGGILPTEAQWEKAARGTDGRTYPWGNQVPSDNLLNFNYDIGDTTEVGKYPAGASPYGLLDMAGNVYQWTSDWFDYNYYATLGQLATNPQDPQSPQSDSYGSYKVLRGSSWRPFIFSTSTTRDADYQMHSTGTIGFRCVMSAAQ
ncbi:MAG: SUMF1/EgtB/PvdO family nonheme iron enzyme [Anaerolineales bacterium]